MSAKITYLCELLSLCSLVFYLVVSSLPHHTSLALHPSFFPCTCGWRHSSRGYEIQSEPEHVCWFILPNGCHLQLKPILYPTLSPPNLITPTECPLPPSFRHPDPVLIPLLLSPPNISTKTHTDIGKGTWLKHGMEIVRLALHCLFFWK